MTTYPFVPAYYDNYGPRKGPTLGLMYHMAEGGGTVGYLDKVGNPPARGVSVHAVCEYSGRVVQMLKWTDASGSLNPADRSTDKAYFGHAILVDVLGDWWTDPNSAVISMEIEGVAVDGPNAKQVAAAVAWGLDMRSRFPSIRGALGHADQTDTKRCPGATPPMRAIFDGVGGHGLFTEDEMTDYRAVGEDWQAVSSGAPVRLTPDRSAPAAVTLPDGTVVRTIAQFKQGTEAWRVTRLPDGRTGFLIRGDLTPVTPGGDPAVDAPFLAYVQRQPVTPDAVSCKPFSDAAVAAHDAKAFVDWKP